MSKVLVTGGRGLIGRALQEIEPDWVYPSSRDYDLTDWQATDAMFYRHNPEVVIHLAGKVGGIEDNIKRPVDYFNDNININTNVVEYAWQADVKKLIAMLSTCAYPNESTYPMTEDQLFEGPPPPTNFAYAMSKRALATQIEAYNQQYKTRYSYLIPCNVYGKHDKYGENSHFIAALIKKIHEADDHIIRLMGTGKPLRQHIYANDVARIISYCVKNDIYENMNVCPDEVLSIKEITQQAISSIAKKAVSVMWDKDKPDGQYRKDASNKKLKKLIPDFKFTSLSQGIKETYEYYESNFRS